MKIANIYKIIDEKYRNNLILAEEKLQKATNIEDMLKIKIDPLYDSKYSQRYDPLFLLNKELIGTERELISEPDTNFDKSLKIDNKIAYIISNLEKINHKCTKESIHYNKNKNNGKLNLIDLNKLESNATYGIPSSYILPYLRIEDLISQKDEIKSTRINRKKGSTSKQIEKPHKDKLMRTFIKTDLKPNKEFSKNIKNFISEKTRVLNQIPKLERPKEVISKVPKISKISKKPKTNPNRNSKSNFPQNIRDQSKSFQNEIYSINKEIELLEKKQKLSDANHSYHFKRMKIGHDLQKKKFNSINKMNILYKLSHENIANEQDSGKFWPKRFSRNPRFAICFHEDSHQEKNEAMQFHSYENNDNISDSSLEEIRLCETGRKIKNEIQKIFSFDKLSRISPTKRPKYSQKLNRKQSFHVNIMPAPKIQNENTNKLASNMIEKVSAKTIDISKTFNFEKVEESNVKQLHKIIKEIGAKRITTSQKKKKREEIPIKNTNNNLLNSILEINKSSEKYTIRSLLNKAYKTSNLKKIKRNFINTNSLYFTFQNPTYGMKPQKKAMVGYLSKKMY